MVEANGREEKTQGNSNEGRSFSAGNHKRISKQRDLTALFCSCSGVLKASQALQTGGFAAGTFSHGRVEVLRGTEKF